MIEIRSLKPFCPVLATCDAGRVDATLAALGRTRDEVVIVSEPAISALREAEAELAAMRDLKDDLETVEAQLREARAEAAFAKADLHDEEFKRRGLEREVKDLRAKLDRQIDLTGGI